LGCMVPEHIFQQSFCRWFLDANQPLPTPSDTHTGHLASGYMSRYCRCRCRCQVRQVCHWQTCGAVLSSNGSEVSSRLDPNEAWAVCVGTVLLAACDCWHCWLVSQVTVLVMGIITLVYVECGAYGNVVRSAMAVPGLCHLQIHVALVLSAGLL
jgi:hypothetical protein